MEIDPRQVVHPPSTGARRIHETPLVAATAESLAGYGCLVDNPREFRIEIVPWPAQGWRPIDKNTGDQGGVTEGLFEFKWKGETLYRATTRWATVTFSAGATGRSKQRPSTP